MTRPLGPADVVLVAFIQTAFLVATTVAGVLARRAAAAQDQAFARLSRALVADRAAAATRSDRREQERELHDTVLSTLTALARGSLSTSLELTERCASDAQLLRRLRSRLTDNLATPDLQAAITAMAQTATWPGFMVTVSGSADTAGMPAQAVVALTRAAREALINAARHSSSAGATVQLALVDGRVRVEIVDRGSGVVAVTDGNGIGIRRSIVERMADVGDGPRSNTSRGAVRGVVLTWPDDVALVAPGCAGAVGRGGRAAADHAARSTAADVRLAARRPAAALVGLSQPGGGHCCLRRVGGSAVGAVCNRTAGHRPGLVAARLTGSRPR